MKHAKPAAKAKTVRAGKPSRAAMDKNAARRQPPQPARAARRPLEPAPEPAPLLILVERIVLDPDRLAIALRRTGLTPEAGPAVGVAEPIRLEVPVQLRRRGVEMKLLIPHEAHDRQHARSDPSLIKAVARGHRWFEDLATGRAASLRDLAAREGISEGYVGRLIQLAFLAPSIVESVLDGTQPVDLTAARLTGGTALPLCWGEQERLFLG